MKRITLLMCFLVAALYAFTQQNIFTRAVHVGPGHIRSIAQDKEGFLWFGASDGKASLFKFDGSNLTAYSHNPKDSNTIAGNQVRQVLVDESGKIWIAMFGSGLDMFDPLTEKFTHYRHNPNDPGSISSDTVYHIVADKKGVLWIGTKAGLNKFDIQSGKFVNYRHNPNDNSSLSNNSVYTLLLDSKNDLWLGTFSGLNRFDHQKESFTKWFATKDGSGLKSDTITAIHEDSKGNIWIGTEGNNLHSFDRKTNKFTNYPFDATATDRLSPPPAYPPGTHIITFINEDKEGKLWVGSMYGGMIQYDPVNKTTRKFGSIVGKNNEILPRYGSSTGIYETSIYTFYQSNDGIIWVGTVLGNVHHLLPQQKRLPYFNLNSQAVNSFYEDPDGGLWIGLQEGLRYEPKNGPVQVYTHQPKNSNSLNHNIINCIRPDDEGNLWLGTGSGVDKFNPKTKEFKHHIFNGNGEELTNTSSIMYLDDEKQLWVGTTFGLAKIDVKTSEITMYYHDPDNTNSVNNNDVYVVAGKENTLWVGTVNGLDKIDKTSFEFEHYLPGYPILNLFYDSKGLLWVGTSKGLFTYDENSDELLNYKDSITGISPGSVLSVIEDQENNLWLSSYDQIYKINAARDELRVIGSNQGVRPNGLLLADNYVTRDGKIYLGDELGYYAFYPKEFKPVGVPPNFYVSSFSLGNREVMPGNKSPIKENIKKAKEIHLNSKQNSFSFEFNTINYLPEEKISFRYKLENYNDEWQDLGSQNKAHFFNLSPGEYILKIRAISSSGAWSEKVLSIFISLPWWQTWWGISLLVLGAFLIISLASYYRSRQLRRQNKILEEKVNHRTMQLKTSIENLKAAQSQLIQSEKMASLGELTAGIAHEIQNPLNFINNFSEINKELLIDMKEEINKGDLNAIKEIAEDLQSNEDKIFHHGRRADGIVKSMLQHSRINTNVTKEPTDVNKLADEYFRLAYHGLRAKDKSFNTGMQTDFDENLPLVSMVPQDIGRVILNLLTNALYAVNERSKKGEEGYKPMVTIITRNKGDKAEIIVKDNGMGIPESIIEKIFLPFFTTKPTGQGTGLGLSMSYDIITKAHGGELKLNTRQGEGTEFTIILPIKNS